MPFVALLTAFALNLSARADIPPQTDIEDQDQRGCIIEAQMTGDFWLTYDNARDIWKSDADLVCKSWVEDETSQKLHTQWEFIKHVSVYFFSQSRNAKNVHEKVRIQISALTSQLPWNFNLDANVKLKMINGAAHLVDEQSQPTLYSIAIWRDNASIEACESLNVGRILITDRQ